MFAKGLIEKSMLIEDWYAYCTDRSRVELLEKNIKIKKVLMKFHWRAVVINDRSPPIDGAQVYRMSEEETKICYHQT